MLGNEKKYPNYEVIQVGLLILRGRFIGMMVGLKGMYVGLNGMMVGLKGMYVGLRF